MGQTERVTNINQVDQSGSSGQAPIAPAWHTILMILLVLGPLIQATAAERRSGGPLRAPDAVPLYLIGAVVQCIFFAFA